MAVSLQITQEEIVALLSGEIDHHSAKELRETIDDACQRNMPSRLLLDFHDVTFMDSSGIGLIMGRYRLMDELGGQLQVVRVPNTLQKVMRVAGLDKLNVLDNGGKTK